MCAFGLKTYKLIGYRDGINNGDIHDVVTKVSRAMAGRSGLAGLLHAVGGEDRGRRL